MVKQECTTARVGLRFSKKGGTCLSRMDLFLLENTLSNLMVIVHRLDIGDSGSKQSTPIVNLQEGKTLKTRATSHNRFVEAFILALAALISFGGGKGRAAPRRNVDTNAQRAKNKRFSASWRSANSNTMNRRRRLSRLPALHILTPSVRFSTAAPSALSRTVHVCLSVSEPGCRAVK